jgi:beta-glucosidase
MRAEAFPPRPEPKTLVGAGADGPYKRLAGWKRATIAPGESQSISIVIDDRVLRTFDEGKNAWNMAKGEYQVMVGGSSDDTPVLASLVVR